MKVLLIVLALAFAGVGIAEAGYVNGYFRSNGTYVSGYYRTEPNAYKFDNYSFNGDWSNAYNDSYYKPYKPYQPTYRTYYSY